MGKGDSKTEEYPDLRFGPLDFSVAALNTYLSPKQLEIMAQFRESLPTLWPDPIPMDTEFLTDATLCRYLRARDWSLSKAQKMIVETLKWRRIMRPWAITAEDVDIEMRNEGKMYRSSGFDKYNRPILYMKPRKDTTTVEQREVKVKYLVYCVEKCIRAAAQNDRDKITLLIDFKDNTSSAGIATIKMSMEILRILTDHYPERLGTAFICNASWSFTFFWKTISPFLDAVTKKKIFFIKKWDELKEWIDDEILEKDYGGLNDYVYTYDEYHLREDTLFPPLNDDGTLLHSSEVIQETTEGSSKKKSKKKKNSESGSNGDNENVSEVHPTEISSSSSSTSVLISQMELQEESGETKIKKKKHKKDQNNESIPQEIPIASE